MNSGIAVGGEARLRKGIEEQVRKEYQAQLNAAVDQGQKDAIEAEIYREIKKRMKEFPSRYSLWGLC